jgi:hypothetical protein
VVEGIDMKSESELAAVFCDRAKMGALSGPGESVQMTFVSTVVGLDETIGQVPAFRVAMTRLAFSEFADMVAAFRIQLQNEDQKVIRRSN